MPLSDHSQRPIDDAYVRSLEPEAWRGLLWRLLRISGKRGTG